MHAKCEIIFTFGLKPCSYMLYVAMKVSCFVDNPVFFQSKSTLFLVNNGMCFRDESFFIRAPVGWETVISTL